MKKKFFQILALAALICVPATSAWAQSAPAAASGKSPTLKATSEKGKLWAEIELTMKGSPNPWKLNYPEKLLPKGAEKPLTSMLKADLKDTVRGVYVVNRVIDMKTGMEYVDELPLKDVVKISWKNEEQLNTARNALVQGNPAAALETAERFLLFFKDLKAVEGSLWLEAAVIKLDALDRQENDALLDSFVREIEDAPGADKIEGLAQKIQLVRLRQHLRKGEYSRVLRDASAMIKTENDSATLAQLTMLKGYAEFNLKKYEEALYTFLRVPVFYGNQTEFVPAAKLEAARCLLKLDGPDRAAQKLPAVADSYIMEVINEFPMTPEAKEALALLPEDRRKELESRDLLEESKKQAAAAASVLGTGTEDDGGASSGGSEDISDKLITIDDDDSDEEE